MTNSQSFRQHSHRQTSDIAVCRLLRALLFLGLLAVALVGPLSKSGLAQLAGGTVDGTVTDSQKAVIPGAVATIADKATGIVTTSPANSDGAYRLTNLQPGTYELTVSHAGFASDVRSDIVVNVGAEVVINLVLNPGNVGQTVTVAAQAETVELASAAVSYSVPGTEIRELPLNGRDYSQLATLQPGVASVGTSGGDIRTGLGNKLAISGGRPQTNNYLWDGISLNDNGNNAPGSVLGVLLGADAVDQFTLLTNSFSAEYGNTAGGVLNAVTRSGTNQLHGSSFLFARNSAMDAANYFDVPGRRPQFSRWQYGASAGGPIYKNRTFWFVDYEGVDQTNGVTTTSVVPTALARAGALLASPPVTVDPEVALALPLFPFPNAPCTTCNADQGNFITVVTAVGNEQFVFGKIDHKFSDKDSIRGNYFYDNGSLTSPDAFDEKVSGNVSVRQGIGLEYTRIISPSLVNVARAGFTRSVQESGNVVAVLDPLLANPELAEVPGKDTGSITVGGGYGAITDGPKSTDHNYEKFNTFQGYENLYWTHGIQTIKVGVDAERLDDNIFLPTGTGGQYFFASFSNFLTNDPSGWTGASLVSTMERGERQTVYGSYIQDDIRLLTNLTVNVGFRYEFTTIPTEVNHRIAILHNLHDPAPRIGGPILDHNPSLHDFSPRIGLTWDPTGQGKTSIHAGFGEYDNLIMQNQYDMILSRSLPYLTEGVFSSSTSPGNVDLPGTFPNGIYQYISGALSERTDYIDPNPPRSYTMQWNFSVQQAFAGWVAQVGYVGARGVHLSQTERNMNSVQPTLVNGVYTYPAFPTQADRLNPVFASINCTDTFNADSEYSAMQISVHRALTRGLLVQGSYTWSKSMDNSSSTSSTEAAAGYPNAIGSPDPLIESINRGLSDFNIESNGIVSVVYDAPTFSGHSAIEKATLGGWEIGTIFTMHTGFPFSAIVNNDIAHTLTDTTGVYLGQRAVEIPGCGPLTRPGNVNHYINLSCFTAPAPGTLSNLRRNTLTAPGLTNVDFSLIKNNKFHGRVEGQLRIEFFNVLNHPNFSAPNFVLYTGGNLNNGVQTTPSAVSNAGVITSTTNNSRQLQLGYKITF
jgi:hypothetical protein